LTTDPALHACREVLYSPPLCRPERRFPEMDLEGASMQAAWKSRRFTNLVRYLLDDWMPPVMREWRPLARALARTFHGQHFDIDFKRKAFHLTEAEFAAAYSRLQDGQTEPYRLTDMTTGQLDWMTAHA